MKPYFKNINQELPIECLRRANKDLIYTVYKVINEIGSQYFVYLMCVYSYMYNIFLKNSPY